MNVLDDMDEEHEAIRSRLWQGVSSCDFVGDSGCSDPDCWRCHSIFGRENLRTLAENLTTAAMLCRAWQMRDEEPDWIPGCNLSSTVQGVDPAAGPIAWLLSRPDLCAKFAGRCVAISMRTGPAIVGDAGNLSEMLALIVRAGADLATLYIHSFPALYQEEEP